MSEEENPFGHKAVPVKLESMPFYSSMMTVKDRTGLSIDDLLSNQVGFRANPSHCLCGHEWNVFDIVIEAVKQSGHDWKFFNEHLTGEFGGFFYREFSLTCSCGITSHNVGLLYKDSLTNKLFNIS